MPKANKVGKSRKAAAAAKTAATGSLLGASAAAADAKNKQQPQPPSKDEGTNQTTKNSVSQGKPPQEETALSRGQRKRLAKREQYLKKEKMIMSTLKLHKQEEQKKRIDGLDALKEALMDTMKGDNKSTEKEEEEEKPTVAIKSNKAKQKVVASELNRMGLVLQHPAFQSNPFEAMQEHLRNTLAKQGEQQEAESKKRILEEKKQAEKRKQDKKERRKGKKHRSKFKATRSRTK